MMSQILRLLSQYGGTVLVCAVLVALVALIVTYMIRNKKKGKSSCGCGCTGCPMSGKCHGSDER